MKVFGGSHCYVSLLRIQLNLQLIYTDAASGKVSKFIIQRCFWKGQMVLVDVIYIKGPFLYIVCCKLLVLSCWKVVLVRYWIIVLFSSQFICHLSLIISPYNIFVLFLVVLALSLLIAVLLKDTFGEVLELFLSLPSLRLTSTLWFLLWNRALLRRIKLMRFLCF
jgi:hypothetical protein